MNGFENTSRKKSNIGILLSFATLIVMVLSQNKDWGSNSMLWWGSVLLFLAIYCFTGNPKIRINEKYLLWVGLFVGLCTISIIWAERAGLVIETMKSLIVHTIIVVLLSGTIRTEEDVKRILNILIISIVINSVYLLLTNQAMFEVNAGFEDKATRLGSEGDWNANGIGVLTSTAALLSVYFLKETESKFQKFMYIAVILLTLFVTLITGSRTSVIKVLAGIACFLFLSSKGKRIRAIILICVLLGVIYYLMMEVPFFYSLIGWRMEGLANLFKGSGTVDTSAQKRSAYIVDAIVQWKKSPIIGYGINCYRVVNSVDTNMYAHNNFVEILADLGVIGFVVYYGGHIFCFKNLSTIKHNSNLKWLFISLLIIILISDYGGVSYVNLLNEVSLMLMFAYIFIQKRTKKMQE